MQGLSEAVVRELDLGAARCLIVAADVGHIIQLRVPGQQLVLAAVFELDEPLADALGSCRFAAERYAAALAAR